MEHFLLFGEDVGLGLELGGGMSQAAVSVNLGKAGVGILTAELGALSSVLSMEVYLYR